RQVYAALKFLYSVTLGRPGEVTRLPFPRRQPSPLPRVLSAEELTAFFAALRKPKYRALFTTCYAAGLRLGEVCRLQVQDIVSRPSVTAHHQSLHARQHGTHPEGGKSSGSFAAVGLGSAGSAREALGRDGASPFASSSGGGGHSPRPWRDLPGPPSLVCTATCR